jgi:hypothetical protein
MTRVALLSLIASVFALGACAADPVAEDDAGELGEDALTAKADEHWFYTGGLPRLENVVVTVSLKGHTAHVSGLAPRDTFIPMLPHVRTTALDGRTRVDVVYPIATANASIGKTNSRPGEYAFYQAKPYRPDGTAFTQSEGEHHVPWGGFPFVAYNQGIAFHGPITSKDNAGTPDQSVWYLRRGQVSGGCNRMLGEHVIELAHIIGANMRKVYEANRAYGAREAPLNITGKVNVIADYDKLGDKWIDVDYATDTGVTRPGKVYGDANVEMFGSWIGTETPDGRDLPPDMKWEGGVSGKPYVFKDHTLANTVCSLPKSLLPKAKELAGSGELPMNLCAKKKCYVDALRAGGAAAARTQCAAPQ